MEKRNDFTFKALAGAFLALFLGVGVFILANAFIPFRQLGPGAGPDEILTYIFLSQAVLSLAMLVLSFYLLFTYLKDYLQLKSNFTLGLIIAIFSFMLFSISSNPLLHVFFGVYGGRGPFPLIPYFFATLSLAILVWVSSR